MTATSSDPTNYKILLVQVNPTNFTLLVTTSSQATAGTSATITLTNPDGGTTTFAMNGGPAPLPSIKVTSVSGRPAHIGKTTVITIHGANLGSASVHLKAAKKGVTTTVLNDTATQIRVAVSVKKGTKSGVATLHIVNVNGTANVAFSIKK